MWVILGRARTFRQCRNPLFIKSEFSPVQHFGQEIYGKLSRRNPLFIKSEFSPHLSIECPAFFSKRCCSRNPLFIKSEFSHNQPTRYLWRRDRGRNPLFIKSEFSPGEAMIISLLFKIGVAILYSSSQNSLQERMGESEGHRRWASRNPLFIKSEFSHGTGIVIKTCGGLKSQSFIHQVRILSGVSRNTPFQQMTGSQSFIHQVRILSGEQHLNEDKVLDGRNPLFIKSEFSLVLQFYSESSVLRVAILYSSSQNSLYGHKRKFANFDYVMNMSQSFIHQVRILSFNHDPR